MLAKKVSGFRERGRPGTHEIKKVSKRGSMCSGTLHILGNLCGFLSK